MPGAWGVPLPVSQPPEPSTMLHVPSGEHGAAVVPAGSMVPSGVHAVPVPTRPGASGVDEQARRRRRTRDHRARTDKARSRRGGASTAVRRGLSEGVSEGIDHHAECRSRTRDRNEVRKWARRSRSDRRLCPPPRPVPVGRGTCSADSQAHRLGDTGTRSKCAHGL